MVLQFLSWPTPYGSYHRWEQQLLLIVTFKQLPHEYVCIQRIYVLEREIAMLSPASKSDHL
jgi:hypothetical protein